MYIFLYKYINNKCHATIPPLFTQKKIKDIDFIIGLKQ